MDVLPRLRRDGFYALPGANAQQQAFPAIEYVEVPRRPLPAEELTGCAEKRASGDTDECKKRTDEKENEIDVMKDPAVIDSGRSGGRQTQQNRRDMITELERLTRENKKLTREISALLREKADWIEKKADLEFEIGDYRQPNEGLAQTI